MSMAGHRGQAQVLQPPERARAPLAAPAVRSEPDGGIRREVRDHGVDVQREIVPVDRMAWQQPRRAVNWVWRRAARQGRVGGERLTRIRTLLGTVVRARRFPHRLAAVDEDDRSLRAVDLEEDDLNRGAQVATAGRWATTMGQRVIFCAVRSGLTTIVSRHLLWTLSWASSLGGGCSAAPVASAV